MGIEEVQRALALARSDETADFGSAVPPEEVIATEDYLDIRFPASYREFVRTVGWCSFGGREFYGITPGGLAATSVPSVVFATRTERQHGLPAGLVIVEDSGGDEQFVLDERDLNAEGEAAVKVWTPASDPTGDLEVVASDFGSYLLQAATGASG